MVSTTCYLSPSGRHDTPVDQVQNVYDAFRQQPHSHQSHAGNVDLMKSPKVQCGYS